MGPKPKCTAAPPLTLDFNNRVRSGLGLGMVSARDLHSAYDMDPHAIWVAHARSSSPEASDVGELFHFRFSDDSRSTTRGGNATVHNFQPRSR